MADIIEVTENCRRESTSEFSGHSGTVYKQIRKSRDNVLEVWEIWAATPTDTNFNAAPVNSLLHDTAGVVVSKKRTAAGWAAIHA